MKDAEKYTFKYNVDTILLSLTMNVQNKRDTGTLKEKEALDRH